MRRVGIAPLKTEAVREAVDAGDPLFKATLIAFTNWTDFSSPFQPPLRFTRSIPFYARTVELVIEEIKQGQAGNERAKRARNS